MGASRPSIILPLVVACLVGLVWLNQGVSSARVDARVATLNMESPLGVAEYLRLNLYARSGDEEIYFAVASALRGLPHDQSRLSDRGASTPAWFSQTTAADGHWHAPYTEVPIEYPIATLPFVLLSSLLAGTSFRGFTVILSSLMLACLIGASALAIRAQPDRDRRERWWAVVWMLLAQGSLAVQRLDAVVALGLACLLSALCERRRFVAGASLGLATALKLVPIVLAAPLLAADRELWTNKRRLTALVSPAAGLFGALALALGPMLLFPGALGRVLAYHGERGLQAESSFGVLLGVWRKLGGTSTPTAYSFGSFNLVGGHADWLASLCTPLLIVLMTGLVIQVARAPAPTNETQRRDLLALALLGAMMALWLSGKVFSPQYLTWAMPVVLVVSGKRGRTLTKGLILVMAVSQLYGRGYYGQVVAQGALGVFTLLGRLLLLVALAVLVWRAIGARAPRVTT